MRNINDLHRYIHLNLGQEIDMLVKHTDLTTEEFQLAPRWKPPPEEGAIGVVVNLSNPTVISESYPPWEAAPMGARECIETFVLFKNEIASWVIRGVTPQVTGPVGIAQLTGEVAKAGISPLMQFAAFISINLAILNLFPIPALDGGRIVFVLLEWVGRGRRVSPKTEGLVHAIGFALLMALLVVLTYQDIIRMITGESLIP